MKDTRHSKNGLRRFGYDTKRKSPIFASIARDSLDCKWLVIPINNTVLRVGLKTTIWRGDWNKIKMKIEEQF